MIHPILDALDASEQAWLKELLFIFNEGNIGKFEALGPRLGQEVLPTFGRVRLRTYLLRADSFHKLRLSKAENLSHGAN